MPDDRTFGYDLILELSDAAVSALITPLESCVGSIDQGFDGYHVTADFEINPTSTTLEFVPPINATAVVEFDLNVSNHNLANLFPGVSILEHDIGLTGVHLRVTHPIGVFTVGGRDILGMDFRSVVPHIEVNLAGALGPGATAAVEAAAAVLVQILLQDYMGYLGTAVPLPLHSGDTDPWTLESCDVRVVTEHCLAILLTTMPGRTVNPDAYTACNLRSGENATVLTSNRWLLQDLACPAVADFLAMTGDINTLFTYDDEHVQSELITPQRVDHLIDRALLEYVPVEALHGLSADTAYNTLQGLVDRVTLQDLRLYVAGGYLGMDGQIRATGVSDGLRATVDFEARGTVSMTRDGDIEILPDVRRTSVKIEVAWWVAVGIFFAALLSPTVLIATVCLAPLVSRLADRIVTAIANALRGLEIGLENPVTFDIPPLPIQIDRIVLDDLTYGGQVVVEPPPPPEPSAWIVGEMEVDEVTSAGVQFNPIAGIVHEVRTTYRLSHVGRFRVEAREMRNPLACRWNLDGQVLDGTGSVEIDDVWVQYTVDGRLCELRLEEGDSLDAILCVEVTGAEVTGAMGAFVSHCIRVEAEGTDASSVWVGVELLHGPSLLDYLHRWEAASAIAIPIDDHPDWSTTSTVLDAAMIIGMDLDLGPGSWVSPGPEPWTPPDPEPRTPP